MTKPKLPSEKKKVGRPSDWTQELEDEIIRRVADGETLSQIGRDERMPHRRTVQVWKRANPDFQRRYASAREEGLERMAEEILEIADDGRNDWMQNADPNNPGYFLNGEALNRSRLRVDTRKWLLSKLVAAYGDKSSLVVEDKTAKPEMPLPELARRIAFLLRVGASTAQATDATILPRPAGAGRGAEHDSVGQQQQQHPDRSSSPCLPPTTPPSSAETPASPTPRARRSG